MGGRRPGKHGRGANDEAQLAVKNPSLEACSTHCHPAVAELCTLFPDTLVPGVAVDCDNIAVYCRSHQRMPSLKVVRFVSYVVEDVFALALDSRRYVPRQRVAGETDGSVSRPPSSPAPG